MAQKKKNKQPTKKQLQEALEVNLNALVPTAKRSRTELADLLVSEGMGFEQAKELATKAREAAPEDYGDVVKELMKAVAKPEAVED